MPLHPKRVTQIRDDTQRPLFIHMTSNRFDRRPKRKASISKEPQYLLVNLYHAQYSVMGRL